MTTDAAKDYAVEVCENAIKLDIACIKRSLPHAYQIDEWNACGGARTAVYICIVVIDYGFEKWAQWNWPVGGKFRIDWRFPGAVSELHRIRLIKCGIRVDIEMFDKDQDLDKDQVTWARRKSGITA